jgi:hypothetical protein
MDDRPRESADSLTGVWDGLFQYADGESMPFTATLIQSGTAFTGTTHEVCSVWYCPEKTHLANLSGERSGRSLSFTKSYDPPGYGYDKVVYKGMLNSEATEISGRWTINPALSGNFLMIRAARRASAQIREKAATI